MSDISSVLSTLEWLNNAVSENQSANRNQNSSPITTASSESIEIISNDTNHSETTVQGQHSDNSITDAELVEIDDINFDLTMKWKIRGVISFKYDIRNFNNEHGIGDVFSFDIKDNSGEITITSFNLTARLIEPRIQKNMTYEINNLCIKTADPLYQTLPNKYQLTTTAKTNVTEIMRFEILPTPYIIVNLKDLNILDVNSVIDIQCQVVRDYGLMTGMTNGRSWAKRELHVIDGNYPCRLTFWNHQAKFQTSSFARSTIKCKYIKIKWFNGNKCLSSMDNTIIIIQ